MPLLARTDLTSMHLTFVIAECKSIKANNTVGLSGQQAALVRLDATADVRTQGEKVNNF